MLPPLINNPIVHLGMQFNDLPRSYCLCKHETSVEFVLIEHGGRSRLSDELMNEPFEVPLEYTSPLIA